MSETQLVIGLSLFFAAWIGMGSWINIRLKSRLLRGLAEALGKGLAGNARYLSLGSSGFIVESTGRGGYPYVGVKLLLGKRDVPLIWLIDYVRGKRDRFELVAKLLGSDCETCECYDESSYWGRLMAKMASRSLKATHCSCLNEKWAELAKTSYYFHANPGKGVCHVRIIGDPARLKDVVKLLLQS